MCKTVWILIRWLLQKPADLDLHCFQKWIGLGSALQRLTLFTHISFSYVPSYAIHDKIYSKTVYHNIHMEMEDNLGVKQCGS